jgi:prepilin-type N-terminal cleavage/methylation domain-containing protein
MRRTKLNKRNQLGFTLVEIAIVLVIVGLLLGAVLKGQELIFNSKVKSTYNMSKEMAAAIYSYQDRYRRLPGDDTQAATRFPAATPVPTNGDGNGYVNWATWPCVSASGGENCQINYHLRLAGFITGSGAESPSTAFGGNVAMAQGNVFITNGPASTVFALEGTGVTHKAMSVMDTSFDDGNPATGAIRCNGLTSYNMSTPDAYLGAWCAIPF